jgi:hypothetical protein
MALKVIYDTEAPDLNIIAEMYLLYYLIEVTDGLYPLLKKKAS